MGSEAQDSVGSDKIDESRIIIEDNNCAQYSVRNRHLGPEPCPKSTERLPRAALVSPDGDQQVNLTNQTAD